MEAVIQQIRADYNAIAELFDKASKTFNEVITHPQIVALAEKWGFDFTGKEVLDLGCGPGGLMLRLNRLGAFTRGIDISEKLLEIAASKGLENLVQGSMHEVGEFFQPGTFDLVVSNYALHYLPKDGQISAIRGVHGILKPGGLFVYSICHPFFLRHSYFDTAKSCFPMRTENYFAPLHKDSWGKEEFGRELHLFRYDWPEIHGLCRNAGFDVLELVDGTLPENIDEIVENSKNPDLAGLVQLFKKNPFAVYVVARK